MYYTMPNLEYERKYDGIVAGIDEVGRGCLAGPVFVAMVALPEDCTLPDVTDSKQVPKDKHRELTEEILKVATTVSVGIATPEEIDKYNINNAIELAVARAYKTNPTPTTLLIDGNQTNTNYLLNYLLENDKLDELESLKDWYFKSKMRKNKPSSTKITQETIVKGDTKSLSIASASIVAKALRDEWMRRCEGEPGCEHYGWSRNAGYGTKEHINAIEAYGITQHHRKSFAPIKNMKV